MNRIKIIQILLLATFVSSCNKDDSTIDYGGDVDTSNAISFGTTAQWTKGNEVSALTDIGSLTLYSYLIEGGWAASDAEVEPYFTDDVATPITLTPADDDHTSWSYDGGSRYWPTDETRMLSFLAYYPTSELTSCVVNEGERPTFSYLMSTLANENEDLVFSAQIDKTASNTEGAVDLAIEHLLTKLTLEVATSGSVNDGEVLGVDGTEEYFFVNGISFTGLYDGATLNIDADGTTSWTIDETRSTIELTAAQNNTIKPIYTYDDSGNEAGIVVDNALTDDYTSVMESGKAIFVLPQGLAINRTSPPSVKIRVRRVYYTADDVAGGSGYPTGEIIYSSEAITIPIPTDTEGETTYTGWESGMHNALRFAFDLTKLSEYDTPLTLISEVYGWSDVTVAATVHPNTYIYTSDGDFELTSEESTADMYVYTNYSSDMRISKTNKELDGTLTTANGFTFYPSGTGDYYIPQLVSPTSDETGAEVLLDCTYDPVNETYSIGDATLTTYAGADGYPDMSYYFWPADDVPGEAVACYPYDSDYTGEMTDEAQWLKFKITTEEGYSFYFYSALLVRGQLGLYTNTAVGDDSSYGVNKGENDAVYILRLDIQDGHLANEAGNGLAVAGVDTYGYFTAAIGAEMLSNGGGKITYKFDVSLKKEL